jgi:hypothetical protein
MLPKLFVFAHFEEAHPFLNAFPSKSLFQLKTIQCYFAEENNIYILITGQGFFNVSVAISVFFERHPQLKKDILCFNVGIAGSFNKSLYDLFYISKIINYHTLLCFYPDVFIHFPMVELVSIEFPADRTTMSAYPDALFDTEGYAYATACRFFLKNHQIHCIKLVSDNDGCIKDVDELLHHYESTVPSVISVVHQLENEVSSFFKKQNTFEEDIHKIVSKLTETFHLTHSQKEQLHKALIYSKQNNKDLEFIYSFGERKISKKERKKHFYQILKRLYCV